MPDILGVEHPRHKPTKWTPQNSARSAFLKLLIPSPTFHSRHVVFASQAQIKIEVPEPDPEFS